MHIIRPNSFLPILVLLAAVFVSLTQAVAAGPSSLIVRPDGSLADPSFLPLAVPEPKGTYEQRVNAGSTTSYTDLAGHVWAADQSYTAGGWGYTSGEMYRNTVPIANTDDDVLYQSQRSNPGEYRFDLPNDTYEVEVRFAEIYTPAPGIGGRIFDIQIEGFTYAANVDIVKLVGQRAALNMTFLVRVTDGQLNVRFVNKTGQAIVNALRVTAVDLRVPPDQWLINAGGLDYRDQGGNYWMMDQPYRAGGSGYVGGSTFKTSSPISNTGDPVLYQTERWGTFSYKFDIPNDNYDVDLLFAEINTPYSAGSRRFDVKIEGTTVLTNYEPYADAGNRLFYAITRTFNITVTDGQLTIDFVPRAGQPAVKGIAVRRSTVDTEPPGYWQALIPSGWATTRTPTVTIQVRDRKSGLDPLSGFYLYSTNGGATFSSPIVASTTGVSGTTAFQTMTAAAVPFNQDSATLNVIRFRIADVLGNVGLSPAFIVRVDATPPVVTMTNPPPGSVVSPGPIVLSGMISDGTSGLAQAEISINGAPYTALGGVVSGTMSASWVYTWTVPPGDATHRVRIRARDVAGNQNDPGNGFPLYIDSAPPVSTIAKPAPGQLITSTIYRIDGAASDATSGVQRVDVSINGGPFAAAVGTTAWSYTWTIPVDGVYNIRSRAMDNAGNVEAPGPGVTVTVDGHAPATVIGSPSAGQLLAGGPHLITGTTTDTGTGVHHVEVSTNGGSTWAMASGTTSWVYPWTPSSDGVYTVMARGQDNAGNLESPAASITVTVDGTPPVATITMPTDGQKLRGSLFFITGSASDGALGSGVAEVQISFDGVAWAGTHGSPTDWYYPWSLPEDGVYTIRARARDHAGNVQGGGGTSVTVTVDNTPPHSTAGVAGTLGDNGWYTTPVTITITSVDATSGLAAIYYRLAGGGWLTYGGPFTVSSDGSPILDYYAVDMAGNAEEIRSLTVSVDTTPPTSQAFFTGRNGGGTWYRGTVTVTLTASDNASGVRAIYYRLDNGAYHLYTGPRPLSELLAAGPGLATGPVPVSGDGTHQLDYYAVDNAGNAETPQSVIIQIDTTPPMSAVTAPGSGQAVSGTMYTVSGAAVDPGFSSGVARVEVSIDGGAWQTATGTTSWTFAWPLPSDGPHNVRSRAWDIAGNGETPGLGITVIVDNNRPSSFISSPYGGQVLAGTSAVISGTMGDPTSGVKRVEVSTNGGVTWAVATMTGLSSWVYTWTLPADGTYILRSRAVDNADNVEIPGPGISVMVDNTRPSSLIANLSDGQMIRGTLYTITGTASDSGAGVRRVEVSVDGGPFQGAQGTTNWSFTWTLPADGIHSIRSRATDHAGNVEVPGLGITVIVDNTPPSSSVIFPTNGSVITSSSVTIQGTAVDALTGVRRMHVAIRRSSDGFYWDDAARTWVGTETWNMASGTTDWSYLWPLADMMVGTYSIRSRATDNTGNVETPGAGVVVIVQRGLRHFVPLILSGP